MAGRKPRNPTASAPLTAKTPAQKSLMQALASSPQVFAVGPAGTGKTYIPTVWSAKALLDRKINKIILTRPNVEAGRPIGFRPGDMQEKLAEWFAEILSIYREKLGSGPLDMFLKEGRIELVPFETMRGRSFNNAFVMLDEAQNTVPREMKMFLTRIGEGSQVFVNGDLSQTDLKSGVVSGLDVCLRLIRNHGINASIVEFTEEDIVRSGICAEWLRAFSREAI